MKQEEKDLLLKDLCARLPYGVKLVQHRINGQIAVGMAICINIQMFAVELENSATMMVSLDTLKPYLRPMSSMTEDEVDSMLDEDLTFSFAKWELPNYKVLDFLNSHHFDYRGLIEKGLALEAPEGIYNIKD